MPTNLVVSVVAVLATNWVTVSRTVPVVPSEQMTYAIVRHNTLNQVGTVVTNYVARFEWKGKAREVVLESVEAVGREKVMRSVLEEPMWMR